MKPYYSIFNHIALHVRNLEQSVEFYQRLFDFETIPDPFLERRITWLDLGNNVELHLIEDAGPLHTTDKFHLCFSVPSIQDFQKKLEAFEVVFFDSKGTKDAISVRSDNVSQIYIHDPDGHKIEINDAE